MADAALTIPTDPVDVTRDSDLVGIPTDPKELTAYWDEYFAWFKERRRIMRPLWELVIAQAQAEDEELYGEKGKRSKAEIAKFIADQSTADLLRLDAELLATQARTSIIVAAATLMFAVFVLRGNQNSSLWVNVGTGLLALSLLMTAVSFFLAIGSLRPPFKKAWGSPYDNRVLWDLQVTDYLGVYVINSWLANRRTRPITKYKQAHSVAIPLLMVAAASTVPGLALVLLFS